MASCKVSGPVTGSIPAKDACLSWCAISDSCCPVSGYGEMALPPRTRAEPAIMTKNSLRKGLSSYRPGTSMGGLLAAFNDECDAEGRRHVDLTACLTARLRIAKMLAPTRILHICYGNF